MTLYDLIYIIGCGVAFMMAIVGFTNSVQVKEEIGDNMIAIFAISLMVSLLSWGVPIWWLGFHYLIEKKVGE
jgi:hypothetical protein